MYPSNQATDSNREEETETLRKMIISRSHIEEKEYREKCTFKPKINPLDPEKANLYGINVKQPTGK